MASARQLQGISDGHLERLRELADRKCQGNSGRRSGRRATDAAWCSDRYMCDPCAALIEYATITASRRA